VIGAIFVSSRKKEVENAAVWLRVRILNSLVFSFSTTVRAIRDSLREAAHVCAASKLHFLFHALKASLFSLESIVERRYNRRPLASD